MANALFLYSFFYMCLTLPVAGQSAESEAIIYNRSLSNTTSLFYLSVGSQSLLYNGIEYPGYPFSFEQGHPFFEDNILPGSIVYDHFFFPNVMLQYDEVKSVLIFHDGARQVLLQTEKVKEFSLNAHKFINIFKDSNNRESITAGFYQVLNDGKVRLLKREVKNIQEDVSSSALGIQRSIENKIFFYVEKAGIYYPVKGKGMLFKTLNDRSKEINHFVKQNRISFKKNVEDALLKVVIFYNSTIN